MSGDLPESHDELLARYDYDLPAEAIAQQPCNPRDHARLLVLDREHPAQAHARFDELGRFLARGDLLVCNDTRVIPARLLGRKLPGGGEAELLLVEPRGGRRWEALLRLSGRLRAGQRIDLGQGYLVTARRPLEDGAWEVEFTGPGAVEEYVERAGHVPLPPYIRRPDSDLDRSWYQTVFARRAGAVAAPTAGLHFTPALLDRLRAAEIGLAHLTLHVGPGTFRPVGADELRRGELHAERYELPAAAAEAINATRDRGGRVVAVGTTSARVLESCATAGGEVRASAGRTRLFIRPPYRPRLVSALITNFHLPRTSLLMLVAAFAGRERVLAAYREAIAAGYRFYSYGDAMLIL